MRAINRLMGICLLNLISMYGSAQISGTVYRDINNSGTRTVAPATPFEPGVYGVTVRAYNTLGVLTGSTTTAANGTYTLPGVTTFPVRLEFITDANEFPGRRPAAGSSNVQFIAATTTTANFGVGYSTMYSNNGNPYTATSVATNGNPTAGGTAGTTQNLFVSPYTLDNTTVGAGAANNQNRWMGSVFGMTYQRETRTLFLAAYLKRHIGFGPGGIDAIYRTNISATGVATQPSILFNLSTFGINVGANPRLSVLPAASNLPNKDTGVFGQVGKRGIGNIDLAENGKDMYITNLFENKIHRINIGMPVKSSFTIADLTGTWTIPGPGLAGTEWHIMGVKYYKGKIYVGGVSSRQRTSPPVNTQADLDADHVNLRGYVYQLDPVTGSIVEVMQFPFNYRRGFCNGDYRYEFKNNWWRAWQNNGHADTLRGDFNTTALGAINPNTGNSTGIYYPQPMLSDIEFDVDGSMILGIRDRFGDQSGFNNFLEGANGAIPVADGRLFRGLNSGEVLRAGKTTGTDTWTMENIATVTTNGVAVTTNSGATPPAGAAAIGGSWATGTGTPMGWGAAANQGFGPGGRYYYFNHAFSATGVPIANIQDGSVGTVNAHYVKSNGGIALMAGYDEMIHTAMDADGIAFTAGLLRFANKGEATGTTAGNMTDQQQFQPWPPGTAPTSPGDPTTMGKSNGMGDVELLQDAMPIEIGNRIWNDVNNNGIQDAGEAGIGTVTVILRSPGADGVYGNGDDQTWTTTTDANGNYYFDNTLVNDSRAAGLGFTGLPTGNTGILNSQAYRLEIDPTQANLSGFRITGADLGGAAGDNIDNDGTQAALTGVGTRVFADVNAEGNNYNFDFGFSQRASLGDRVWRDDNANGLQDAGEPGVAGISVQLFNGATLIATTVTDAYGNYQFNNLAAGSNYTVKFTPPANYTFTAQTNTANDQANDATGSDVNPATGTSYVITLAAGENEPDIDAGLIFSQPVTQSLGDKVFIDSNNNGIQDATEPGVAGVTVTLYRDLNNDGDLGDAGENIPYATTITNASGNYIFTNLPTGNYQVGTTLPAAFRYATANQGGGNQTLGDPAENGTDSDVNPATGKTAILNLGAGENLNNVDIGLVQNAATTASVGDFVWNDLNQNGIQDAGEPGIPGVTVTLFAQDGITVIATTVTDAFGGYMFTNLTPNTNYVIGVTTPSGFTLSPQNVGADDYIDSDVNAATGKTTFFNLPAGSRNLSLDAGMYQTTPAGTARLGDRVWFDQDRDGVQDAGEPGVGGVIVSLYTNGVDGIAGTADDVLVATTSTNSSGAYQFVNLAAGNYNVGFSNLPAGFSFTQPVSAGDNANNTNSDANPGTGRTGSFTLGAGESEQTVDAGLVAGTPAGQGSLGNKVWYDINSNGLQDAGETGASGVTITLQRDLNNDGDFTDAGEAAFATTTTNSLGEYIFTGLDAGTYRVQFSNLPTGYNVSAQNSGANDAIDSDGGNPVGGVSTTGNYTLAQGEDNLTVDLGINKNNPARGSISDKVWFDIDGDGLRDAGEPGIAGVTVTLYDNAGAVLAVTTTDANGNYLFDNLVAGTYQVGFSNYPAGLAPTTPTNTITNDRSSGGNDGRTQPIVLSASQNRTDVDFGLTSVRAALGNFVWLDSDGDGVQDAGEPGVPGVTVSLFYDANNDGDFLDAGETVPVTSMITDQNGEYLFTNLNPGNYQVAFTTVPGGLSFTTQNTPGDNQNNTNSDASPATGRTGTINLSAGEADLTVDAGLYKPIAQVGDRVWLDRNNDGLQSAGELGVGGVLVTLFNAGPDGVIGGGDDFAVGVQVTNGNGNYLFTSVPPGNYYINFGNAPTGYPFTTQNQDGLGINGAANSDANATTGNTVVFAVTTTTNNLNIDAGLVGDNRILPSAISFNAYKQGDAANLVWTVPAPTDGIRSFVIERSSNGRDFNTLSTVTADGRSNYSLLDVQPFSGVNFYRILIVKTNGSVEYTEVRVVGFGGKSGSVSVFPNPASMLVNVVLPDEWQGNRVRMELFNQQGQLVSSRTIQRANQTEQIGLSGLPAGQYRLNILNDNGKRLSLPLQVQR
jgi:SdrD B-like domain/Secretion system C-terminal sorting domain